MYGLSGCRNNSLKFSCPVSGSRLISLNQTSLEGVTFSEAAEIMQSSPNQVELIISQFKGKSESGSHRWILYVSIAVKSL